MKIQNRLKETIQNIVYDELSKHANEQLNMSSDAVHNQLSIAISDRILGNCLCNEHSKSNISEKEESKMRELEIHRSMYRGEG